MWNLQLSFYEIFCDSFWIEGGILITFLKNFLWCKLWIFLFSTKFSSICMKSARETIQVPTCIKVSTCPARGCWLQSSEKYLWFIEWFIEWKAYSNPASLMSHHCAANIRESAIPTLDGFIENLVLGSNTFIWYYQ